MKRFYIGLLTGLFIGLLLTGTTMVLASQPIKLIINGKEVACDVAPQIINGRTMVPARFVADALGAAVAWDENNNAVIINSSSNTTSNTSVITPDNKTKEQYQSFRAMFTMGEKIFHPDGGDISSKVTYNGNLSQDDFLKYWNSIDKSNKETLAKQLGAELQSINPTMDIAIDFWYKNIKLGYVLAYSDKYQICSFLDNPQLKQSDINQ